MISINGVKTIDNTIFELGGSKSESNRALMIAAYSGLDSTFVNLSTSNDTQLLCNLLVKISQHDSTEPLVVDCCDAGTVCRFLLTYLASHSGTFVLTGCQRLCQRPIKPLVDCLRQLGADIEYVSTDGQLPILVKGKEISGGESSIDASASSQFVSSVLLAAPTFRDGIVLDVSSCSSVSYVEMTIAMMKRCGAEIECNNHLIRVLPKQYSNTTFFIENDWSSASYLYEYVALQRGLSLSVDGLYLNSLQGDRVVVEMMNKLGVQTIENEHGITIISDGMIEKEPTFDFISAPDLFPSICATCAALGVKAHFVGIKNLIYKESSRVESMRIELNKIGVELTYNSNNEVELNPIDYQKGNDDLNSILFNVYDDHRIAMSLSLLTIVFGNVVIDNELCVSKSFPTFWKLFK